MKNLSKKTKRLFKSSIKRLIFIWLFCIVGVFCTIFYVVGIRKQLFNEAPSMLAFLILGFVIVGFISFILLIIELIKIKYFKNKLTKNLNIKYITKRLGNNIHLGIIAILILLITILLVKNQSLFLGTRTEKLPKSISNTLPTIDENEITSGNVIAAINKKRLENELSIYIISDKLNTAADKKAEDILNKNYWSNNAPDGTTPWTYIANSGYSYNYSSLLLGKGFYNTSNLMNAWMNDKTNKDNILSKNHTDIGVSIKSGNLQGESTKIAVVFLASEKNKNKQTNVVNNTTKTYIDPDSIISCNFKIVASKQMKRSECLKSFECQINSQWYIYTSREKCTEDQKSFWNNRTGSSYTSPSYPPCIVYYPALHTSSTYSYTSPETCKQWQDTANTGSTNTFQPTQQPTTIPAQDNSEYNELLRQHAEACKGVVAEWNTIKENFYATEYNNFSSSAEAVQELERRRQKYQQEAYSVGCTQTISL